MKNKMTQFLFAACAAATVMLSSCAKKDTADSLSDEAIEQMNTLADAMAAVKDKATAEAAVKTMEEVATKMEDIAKRLEALGDPSEEDKKRISEKMEKAEEAAQEKMKGMFATIMSNQEVATILQGGMEKLGERMDKVEKTFKKYKVEKDEGSKQGE